MLVLVITTLLHTFYASCSEEMVSVTRATSGDVFDSPSGKAADCPLYNSISTSDGRCKCQLKLGVTTFAGMLYIDVSGYSRCFYDRGLARGCTLHILLSSSVAKAKQLPVYTGDSLLKVAKGSSFAVKEVREIGGRSNLKFNTKDFTMAVGTNLAVSLKKSTLPDGIVLSMRLQLKKGKRSTERFLFLATTGKTTVNMTRLYNDSSTTVVEDDDHDFQWLELVLACLLGVAIFIIIICCCSRRRLLKKNKVIFEDQIRNGAKIGKSKDNPVSYKSIKITDLDGHNSYEYLEKNDLTAGNDPTNIYSTDFNNTPDEYDDIQKTYILNNANNCDQPQYESPVEHLQLNQSPSFGYIEVLEEDDSTPQPSPQVESEYMNITKDQLSTLQRQKENGPTLKTGTAENEDDSPHQPYEVMIS